MNSPAKIAENYVGIGVSKVKLKPSKAFVLAVLAGIFISAAGIGTTAADVSVSASSVAKLISALIFPAGLAMVIVAGSELFTGNCLLIIPLMEKKVSVGDVVKNLVIVYIGNLLGSLLFSFLLAYGGVFSLFNEDLAASCVSTAVTKVSMPFLQAFIKGILCNIFVCIAVWMTFAADTVPGKIMGLYFPIMLFVLSGFEHCVANMGYIANGLFAKELYGIEAAGLTWGTFFTKNLIPVSLGNIVGGMAVGLAYWYVYLHKDKNA